MGKIFCIMGRSSTGKDTIYKEVTKRISLREIVGYTTRPIRENEKEGVEYHFVSRDKKDELEKEGKVIEIRTYNTVHGPWDYFTVNDGQVKLEESNYIVIATVDSFLSLQHFYGEENVIPIYIYVEDGIRLQRAIDREKLQSNPKYEELCRRFVADSRDFSQERLEKAKINKIFENHEIESTVDEIVEYIKEFN